MRISLDARLAGGDFYLIAAPAFTGDAADQVYSGALPRGGAALHDPDLGWVDGMAVVAGSPCGEGDPAPRVPERVDGAGRGQRRHRTQRRRLHLPAAVAPAPN